MTDALLERVSRLDHITELDLEGSKALTDAGLWSPHAAAAAAAPEPGRMREDHRRGPRGDQPPARSSSRSRWRGRGSPMLVRHICAPARIFRRSISAARRPATAPFSRSPASAHLRDFRSGNGVTDAGMARLHDLPVFKTWHGFDPELRLTQFASGRELPDAPRPLHQSRARPARRPRRAVRAERRQQPARHHRRRPRAARRALPHFGWLAFDAKDESMPYIAALPHLRFLMCQDTAAGDDGFAALSRSRTIEYIWGRRCHNLQRRGFMALADMPALRRAVGELPERRRRGTVGAAALSGAARADADGRAGRGLPAHRRSASGSSRWC